MEKSNIRKNILIILCTAFLFFIITIPFRTFFQVVSVTEVRPASVLNPLSGLLFGVVGAFGCALGNLIADIWSGYTPITIILGFFVQLIYGLVPWAIWKHFKWEVRLNTSSNVFRYMAVMLFDSVLTGFLLGVCMQITNIGTVFSMTTLMLILNNFVFCMVLGTIIIMIYTKVNIKATGGRISLNERFILTFLSLAILSAAMIGFIAYHEVAFTTENVLDLWNRIYIYISLDLFLFCVVIVVFVRYAEKNITIPMEKIAKISYDYIKTKQDGTFDAQKIISECDKYTAVHGEAGNLAKAFQEMALNLDCYIEDLTKITAEKERIGAELDVATQIQADMLPNIFPAFPERSEISIFASMNPAKEVGGDFYDFFLVDDKHLALVIADVSGKGIPAALFMVISKTLIKNEALTGQSPKEILMKVNNQLYENNQAQMFVTVWLGILDLETGKMVASNAGHEYPAIRKAGGEFELFEDPHGFVLAGMDNMPYNDYEIQLNKGDTIFVYTDGVPESSDSQGNFYGLDRMIEGLNQDINANPEKLLSDVTEHINQFIGDATQFDDITMLAMTYHGEDEKV